MKPKKLGKGFRLEPKTVARLHEVATVLRRTETDVLEQLLVEYLPRLATSEADRIAEAAAKYGEKSPS